MERWLLNGCYLLLLAVLSPWLLWQAIRHGKYREGVAAKMLGRVDVAPSSLPTVWVHAVSVGEVKLAAKLVPALAARFPGHRFVISSTSRTGYRLAQSEFARDDCQVTYAPLDFSWAVEEAIRRIRPVALVLVELELWPNLISSAYRQDCKMFVINGRLSERSFAGYQKLTPLVAAMLRKFTWIGAQNETYRERFVQLGAKEVTTTGSIKFDGLPTSRENDATTRLAGIAGITPDDTIWLAGSTQPQEDEMVARVFLKVAQRFPALRLIIVPRHPENFKAATRTVAKTGLSYQVRSHLSDFPSPDSRPAAWRILVVDAVGELSAWWGTADIAFVGGSFGRRGGQNMIEPAAFGAAVSFGPNTINFREVSEALLSRDAAEVVPHEAALQQFVTRCCTDPSTRFKLGNSAQAWVRSQAGALDTTCDQIQQHLRSARRSAA